MTSKTGEIRNKNIANCLFFDLNQKFAIFLQILRLLSKMGNIAICYNQNRMCIFLAEFKPNGVGQFFLFTMDFVQAQSNSKSIKLS